jgi:uncharacterized membrane protein
MKDHYLKIAVLIVFCVSLLTYPTPAFAQEGEQEISITTTYPSQIVELGETINVDLDVSNSGSSQTIDLKMAKLPEGWEANFRGGGKLIKSVFVKENSSVSVDLQLIPPEDSVTGEHEFIIRGQGEGTFGELSLLVIIAEKVPGSLDFKTDLPTIKGSPDATFRYSATLDNNGDKDLTINLSIDTPTGFLPKFTLSGKEISSFPLEANHSKTLTIELEPIAEIPAGEYPFTVYANGGELQAELNLTAVVSGQQNLQITGVDGRLSAKVTAGKETPINLLVKNIGTAPAQGVELSASAPSGWTVSFEPESITEIPAGEQVEVTANIIPSEKAIAGDYMATFKAKPIEGANESAEFRITVTTSTLWGFAGVALIAVAVGVVAIAVMRFGRR